LKGALIFSSGIKHELVTPTGAAMIRALECRFSPFPAMIVEAIGYGAGSRNLKGRPNVLRISVGELDGSVQALGGGSRIAEDREYLTRLRKPRGRDDNGGLRNNNGQSVLCPSDATETTKNGE
jgi:Protein of unknown function DUF111